MLEKKLDTLESRLEGNLLNIITVSKAIGLYNGIGPELFNGLNNNLLRNIRAFLAFDNVTLAVFEAAMRDYDSLASGHPIRKKVPFDLIKSAYTDVVNYCRDYGSSAMPIAVNQ